MMKARIVTDKWLGYEVQLKHWWWPFWLQAPSKNGPCNTHESITHAEYFIKNKLWGKPEKFVSKVIKTVDIV